jgi:peroxiredoxin Q/BCP
MTDAALIAVGARAPDFALPASDGRTYTLADELTRHHVVLVFYPGNNTPG